MLRSNVKAEIATLATLANTTRRERQGELFMKLRPEYFGTDATRELFDRIKEVSEESDAIPNFKILRRDQKLSDAAKALIRGYDDSLLKREEVDITLEQLRVSYRGRIMADFNEMLAKQLTSSKIPKHDDFVKMLETALYDIQNPEGTSNDILHGGIGDSKASDMLVNILKGAGSEARIKTGWGTFDTKSGGFTRGDLVVLTANFGGGKSVGALTLFRNMHYSKYNVALASMEMTNREIMERMVSGISGVEYSKIRLNQLSRAEKRKVSQAFDEFEQVGTRWTYYAPSTEVTINDIFRTLAPHKYDVIFVDYIGLLKHNNANKNMREDQLLGETARKCKVMASKLNCVVVLLAQLNDEGKVFSSRAITHHASWWFKWTMTEEDKTRGFVNVEQGKARSGECFDFYLTTNFAHMTMDDYTGPVDDSGKDKEDPKFPKAKSGQAPQKKQVKMSLMDD